MAGSKFESTVDTLCAEGEGGTDRTSNSGAVSSVRNGGCNVTVGIIDACFESESWPP